MNSPLKGLLFDVSNDKLNACAGLDKINSPKIVNETNKDVGH